MAVSSSPTIFPPSTTSSTTTSSAPLARNKMSITQTYYLVHAARSKLSREAARADHDLRLLVGHANLLDSLMLDVANAEKEQERWFNNTVRIASKPVKPVAQHIRWADTVEEESIEDYDEDSDISSDDGSDSDSDSDYDEEELQIAVAVAAASPALIEDEELEAEDDDEEEAARLTLTRTPSRQHSPPELLDDESSDSEEDSMPPSPTDIPIDTFVSAQDHPAKRTPDDLAVFDHTFIEHQGTMIPAY